MAEKSEKPETKLVQCQHEFQEKLHQMQSPPPPVIRAVPSRPESDYNVLDEINNIYRLIKANGHQGDFGIQIRFGDLIPLCGGNQIDKLVETLAVARKNGFINYNLKAFLDPDRDEDVCIRLVKTPY